MLAQVRALGHKAAGHSTAVQLFVRVQRFQITLELEPVSAGVQRLPDFFLGQVFQDLYFFIAHAGAAIGVAFAGPLCRHGNDLVAVIQ